MWSLSDIKICSLLSTGNLASTSYVKTSKRHFQLHNCSWLTVCFLFLGDYSRWLICGRASVKIPADQQFVKHSVQQHRTNMFTTFKATLIPVLLRSDAHFEPSPICLCRISACLNALIAAVWLADYRSVLESNWTLDLIMWPVGVNWESVPSGLLDSLFSVSFSWLSGKK